MYIYSLISVVQTGLENFEFRLKLSNDEVRYILSHYFGLRTRLWTQIRLDRLIQDSYQDVLKSFGKFEIRNKV